MNKFIVEYQSPIGMVEIVGSNEHIYSILFIQKEQQEYKLDHNTSEVVKLCYQQIDEYFQGKRQTFTFPIKMEGTPFQTKVWNALTTISYGETGSYKHIAQFIDNSRAIRAVGSANGKNKLSIVLPCHRIIGANGTLTGYAGGLWRKEWLLLHEQKYKNSETII